MTLCNFSFPLQQQGNFSRAGLTLSSVAKCHALRICIVEFARFKVRLPLGALCARLREGRLKSFILLSPNSLVQWHSIQFEPFGNQLLLSILNLSCFVYVVEYFSFWTKGSTLGILRGRFDLSELAGRPDHCRTSQLANEIYFFQGFLLKKHLPRAYYLGLDWSGRSEILISTGTVWPVSSDKWKAPLVIVSGLCSDLREYSRSVFSPVDFCRVNDLFWCRIYEKLQNIWVSWMKKKKLRKQGLICVRNLLPNHDLVDWTIKAEISAWNNRPVIVR